MPEIQISLTAEDLTNTGTFSTADPMAVVKLVVEDEDPVVLGKTEVVKNELSPKWMRTFVIDYDPEMQTAISVQVYDKEEDSDNKMGGTFFDIGNIIQTGMRHEDSDEFEGVKGKRLRGGGTLYCRIMEKWDAGKLNLMLRGVDLKNREGWLATSDPFYELCRQDGEEWVSVHRSEKVKNNLNPIWSEEKFDLSLLCDDDFDLPLRLVVYDHEGDGDHKLIGYCEVCVNELLAAKAFGGGGDTDDNDANSFLLTDDDDEDAGCVVVINAHVTGVPDFENDVEVDDEDEDEE